MCTQCQIKIRLEFFRLFEGNRQLAPLNSPDFSQISEDSLYRTLIFDCIKKNREYLTSFLRFPGSWFQPGLRYNLFLGACLLNFLVSLYMHPRRPLESQLSPSRRLLFSARQSCTLQMLGWLASTLFEFLVFNV